MENGKNLKIVIVILSVLVLGLGGYLIYDKIVNKEKDTLINDNNPNVQNNKMTEAELDILGKKLFERRYAYVIFSGGNQNQNAISSIDKAIIAYRNVEENKIVTKKDSYLNLKNTYKGEIEEYMCEDNLCNYQTIKKEDFLNTYYSIWGYSENVILPDIFNDPELLMNCEVANDSIVCFPGCCSPSDKYPFDFFQYNKTEQNDDIIIVYANYFYLDNATPINDNSCKLTFCDDDVCNNKKTITGNFTSCDLSEFPILKEYKNGIVEDNGWDDYLDYFVNKFENVIGTYKITFKKDKLDNYYWYSTEYVNK